MEHFTTTNEEGYAVVTMHADALDALTVPELRSVLVLLSGSQVGNIILDLQECQHCDTTGLSAILIAHRLCKDGALMLAGVAPEVATMLSFQRFDPELTICQNVDEAKTLMSGIINSVQ